MKLKFVVYNVLTTSENNAIPSFIRSFVHRITQKYVLGLG